MKLEDLQANWEAFGAQNPLWAVLTSDTRWDPEAFFATGVREIADLVQEIDGCYPALARDRALDFGCGAGRLAQGLARYFEHVDGVDISPSMVEVAKSHNAFGDRCQYHLNARDDLHLFRSGSFDLVYSNIVLQHMEPRYARRYLGEFLRVLRPGGLVVFQLPSELRGDGPLKRTLRRLLPTSALVAYRSLRDRWQGRGVRRAWRCMASRDPRSRASCKLRGRR